MFIAENELMPRIANHRRYCMEQLMFIIAECVPGDIAEFGIGSGKNTFNLATMLKDLDQDRKLFAYDTYEGLPYTDAQTGAPESSLKPGECYAITLEQLRLESKLRSLSEIIIPRKGLAEEVFKTCEEKLSFVWFDMDLYKPTSLVYKMVEDRVNAGGVIGFHDYEFGRCPGIKVVVDKEINRDKFRQVYRKGSSIFFKRK